MFDFSSMLPSKMRGNVKIMKFRGHDTSVHFRWGSLVVTREMKHNVCLIFTKRLLNFLYPWLQMW